MSRKILFSWSGGKDSAFALHEAAKAGRYEIVALVATVTEGYDRISMHGVRRELLKAQVAAAGLPLEEVWISQGATNEEYESKIRQVYQSHREQGVEAVAFGDIFLEDLKEYREKLLASMGLECLFPLWKRPTPQMAHEFIDAGFRAWLSCVDTQVLDGSFAGRAFDQALLDDLPDGIDPCGENGEFHSFVHAGPIFPQPIACHTGQRVLRDQRWSYCDILPGWAEEK